MRRWLGCCVFVSIVLVGHALHSIAGIMENIVLLRRRRSTRVAGRHWRRVNTDFAYDALEIVRSRLKKIQ